jgi:HEAT repeat protein
MKKRDLTKCIAVAILGTLAIALCLPSTRPVLRQLMASEYDQPARRWIADLGDADAEVRHNAARELCRLGTEAAPAVPALGKALSDPDMGVRVNAACTLVKLGAASEPILPALKQALHDECQFVRADAVLTIRSIGPDADATLQTLVEAVQADDNRKRIPFFNRSVRELAVGAFRVWGAPAKDAIPVLTAALQDPDLLYRIQVAQALYAITADSNEVVPVLTPLLKDRDQQIRGETLECLAGMGQGAKSAIPAIRACLQDENAGIRRFAAEAIRDIERQPEQR